MTHAPFFDHDAVAPALLPSLEFTYADLSLPQALARTGTLAVLGFGAQAPVVDDPRYLRVGLRPLTAPRLEIWRSRGTVRYGRDGIVRWSCDGDWLFGAIELDESVHGGLAAASEMAYRALCSFSARVAQTHVLRVWNYLDAINLGEGDAERYRAFCTGRAAGIDAAAMPTFPAASAIGRCDGVRVLQVYWLAARCPGQAVENPRQVSAWCYPRQYGPNAPTFARGMRAPALPPQLHVSGTAAVVGHASQHDADLPAQIAETFANLDSLFRNAGTHAGFGAQGLVKAYLRHAADADAVAQGLARRLPPGTPVLLLEGDICRRELLVEVDGVQGA